MKRVRVVVGLALVLAAFAGTVTPVARSPTAAADSRAVGPHPTTTTGFGSAPSAAPGLSSHGRFDDAAARAHGGVVVIAVENAATNRSIAPAVREAAEYWARHSRRYTGFRFEYRVESDAADPTYRVRVVDSIDSCGRNGTYLACTGVVGPREPVTNHSIRVVDGMARESLVYALVHEFGHALGLRHGDRPRGVMNATYEVTWRSETRQGADSGLSSVLGDDRASTTAGRPPVTPA
ncbi:MULTISPECIES: matrixin family metalloprotease [Halorussus]|uniref:matrixin family metalloprotease n=1 Tax=Halorussus TaxID=1070314 RepID=UPI000E20E9ED|nr:MULTISPECIES: matrixin family metalloprotease [Halorussus]NHN58952.1 matrixin family metalloprotease [Halorussus sp. JP-T4]